MPRRARMYLPGYPCHSVQRGNNREACFVEPEKGDYQGDYGHPHIQLTPA